MAEFSNSHLSNASPTIQSALSGAGTGTVVGSRACSGHMYTPLSFSLGRKNNVCALNSRVGAARDSPNRTESFSNELHARNLMCRTQIMSGFAKAQNISQCSETEAFLHVRVDSADQSIDFGSRHRDPLRNEL